MFEFPKGSATLTTVAAFAGSNGANPYASVTVDASGNLYGTTYSGGANGYGTVYEIASGSGTITTVASFNRTNGSYPEAGVTLDQSGNLFGTTHNGGAYGYGTIFEIAQGSTTITTLVPLGSYSGGPYPPRPEGSNSALVLDSSGNLYGTSDYGGGYLEGTVFELARGTTATTTLTSFNYNDRTGMSRTVGSLVRNASGNIYGMAYGMTPLGTPERNGLPEPTSNGTVFEIAGGTSATTTIASFEPIDGESPTGSLAEDASGDVFGMTSSGGTQLCGTLYEVAAGTSSISLVASFAGATALHGGSVKDAAGDSYGVTLSGGPDGAGTVFEIAAGSTVTTTLASFDARDGAYPVGLALDASGNIYQPVAKPPFTHWNP